MTPADERALLERRRERLRAPPKVDAHEDATWLAVFPLAGEDYAIPLEALVCAVPLKLVTPTPLAPSPIIGVVRHEGDVLAAYSLAALVGSSGWSVDPTVLLVVRAADRLVAIDSEVVPRALSLSLTKCPKRVVSDALIEVTTPELRLIRLLDPDRLLAPRELLGR